MSQVKKYIYEKPDQCDEYPDDGVEEYIDRISRSGTRKMLKKPSLSDGNFANVDSGTDYWYQSYATGANNQSASKKPIETKVVGVTYEGRQSIVALLSVGEEVQLVREPDNPYDRNAIRVVRKTGQCFGFISKFLAAGLASKFDDYGKPVEAVVTSITGGYYSDANIGVTIQFNLPETSDNVSDSD